MSEPAGWSAFSAQLFSMRFLEARTQSGRKFASTTCPCESSAYLKLAVQCSAWTRTTSCMSHTIHSLAESVVTTELAQSCSAQYHRTVAMTQKPKRNRSFVSAATYCLEKTTTSSSATRV